MNKKIAATVLAAGSLAGMGAAASPAMASSPSYHWYSVSPRTNGQAAITACYNARMAITNGRHNDVQWTEVVFTPKNQPMTCEVDYRATTNFAGGYSTDIVNYTAKAQAWYAKAPNAMQYVS